MNNTEKKPFGEDKLSKLVRLMKRYEGELEGTVNVELNLTSEGYANLTVDGEDIYGEDINKVVEFLEAGQLKRTLMVRG